jgi:hypothetical protein
MAGRGTDIILGGSSKGVAKVIAKYLLLVALGITPNPKVSSSSDSITQSENIPEDEIETDPDVLALPSVLELAQALDFWIPRNLTRKTELSMKRAVISCAGDYFSVDKILQHTSGIDQLTTNAHRSDSRVIS